MRPARLQLYRITPLRPLRPPNGLLVSAHHRVFTTRTPLLRISHGGPRPQLPFLSPSYATRHALFKVRPLSTEQKANIRYQLRLAVYWTLMFWLAVGAFWASYFVLRQDWLDRKYPAPEDWNVLGKFFWRKGKHEEEEEAYGRGMTDWATVGSAFRNVQNFCEQGMEWRGRRPLPRNTGWDRSIPGIDVAAIEQEPLMPVAGIEKTGYDASLRPEPWRRAYFHALMGIAKVSEVEVGWVRDKKRHILFPADQIIGPTNPNPKPIWHNSPPAPLEEDCEPAYDSPDLWYTRILTTGGLSRDQRIAAALAYASWEDFNGDAHKARALYNWSLHLAAVGPEADQQLPDRSQRSPSVTVSTPSLTLVNAATGIIPPNAPYTTSNILAISSALASHHARTGSLSQALSIYLSVLRARRAAPEATPSQQYPPKGPDFSLTSVDSVLFWLTSLPSRSRMAPPPPMGDLPFQRTAASACDDAAMMNYIGEILFASTTGAQGRREALSWTRDAVGIAEIGATDKKLADPARRVCSQCLGSGLENWHKMVGIFAQEEEESRGLGQAGSSSSTRGPEVKKSTSWSLWSPFPNAQDTDGVGIMPAEARDAEGGEWAKEEQMIAARRAAYLDAKLMAQLNRHISTKSAWFVV